MQLPGDLQVGPGETMRPGVAPHACYLFDPNGRAFRRFTRAGARTATGCRTGLAGWRAEPTRRVTLRAQVAGCFCAKNGAVGGDNLRIEVRAVLRRAPLACEVDVHDAKALRIAERPFEIVEQRPDHVAAHVDTLLDRVAHGADVLTQVVNAQRILDAGLWSPSADRRRRHRSR